MTNGNLKQANLKVTVRAPWARIVTTAVEKKSKLKTKLLVVQSLVLVAHPPGCALAVLHQGVPRAKGEPGNHFHSLTQYKKAPRINMHKALNF